MLVSEKAMLARLKISSWGAQKHDKTISDKVAAEHQADPSMGRYNKRLVAKERLDDIRQLATQARHHHYEHTLPWLDDGSRLLPAAAYFDYMAEQNALKADFEAAVAVFAFHYPGIVADAKRSLNGLFDPADYPDQSQIAGKFSMAVEVDKLPEADDFRVSLSEDENARIREAIQERLDQGVSVAMNDVWQRVRDTVGRMVERLGAYEVDADGKVHNTFRDSLVTNVRALVELLPNLNITGDNQLEDMRHRLDGLCQVEAPTLREDATQRAAIAAKASAILAEVNELMA